ncbi:MAG: hypothetical protein ACM31F_00355 [Gemmatimonas sp.]
MVFHRARITRFIAAILAIALSAQVAGAQAVNCMMMRDMQANGDHSAMMQHHASSAGYVTTSSSSHTQTPGTTTCSQTILCANAAAIPVAMTRSMTVDHTAPPIQSGQTALEARDLRPDSPPPKI